MNDTMLMLVVAECEGPVKQCVGGLKDKLRAAMNAAKNHWMAPDDDTKFRGAVGAVMAHYGKDSEEYKRMEHEIGMLRKFSAMISAAQAGLTVGLPDTEGNDEQASQPIGLMKLWKEEIERG